MAAAGCQTSPARAGSHSEHPWQAGLTSLPALGTLGPATGVSRLNGHQQAMDGFSLWIDEPAALLHSRWRRRAARRCRRWLPLPRGIAAYVTDTALTSLHCAALLRCRGCGRRGSSWALSAAVSQALQTRWYRSVGNLGVDEKQTGSRGSPSRAHLSAVAAVLSPPDGTSTAPPIACFAILKRVCCERVKGPARQGCLSAAALGAGASSAAACLPPTDCRPQLYMGLNDAATDQSGTSNQNAQQLVCRNRAQ